MATNYRPYEPRQMTLLSEAIQDCLPEGHLAHFIGDTVDTPDLGAFHARYDQDGPRNQPFHPVPRNCPITPTRAPADIRDANRPAPIWRARRGARRSDGGLVVSQAGRAPMEGPVRLDRAPCGASVVVMTHPCRQDRSQDSLARCTRTRRLAAAP